MTSLSTIEYYERQVNSWNAEATRLDDLQQEMRDVARRLRNELRTLDNLFGPIRDLHTSSTWEGNAATLSRQKLDGHQDRFHSADRTMHGLADDLDARAGELLREEDAARANASENRRLKTKAIGDYNDRLEEERLERERREEQRELEAAS